MSPFDEAFIADCIVGYCEGTFRMNAFAVKLNADIIRKTNIDLFMIFVGLINY